MNSQHLLRKLFWFRISAGKMFGRISSSTLTSLIRELRPQKTDVELIRIGDDTDGGYLVPDDLQDINACFSPGVSDIANFEIDLEKRGIPSHLADATVDGPPEELVPASFTKKHIGPGNSESTMTLEKWVHDCVGHAEGDLLLQMDIEGDEYRTIPILNRDVLKRFRIVLLEVHSLHRLYNPSFFKLFAKTMRHLTKDFVIVHNHPNNCCGSAIIDGVEVPRVMEFTFLRKDRVSRTVPATEFPHPLDCDNLADKPTLELPTVWYRD